MIGGKFLIECARVRRLFGTPDALTNIDSKCGPAATGIQVATAEGSAKVQSESEPTRPGKSFRIPWMLGFCLFLAIALFFLWEEHAAHILGAVPYVLLMLCPLLHLFMHRGHGSHAGGGSDHEGHGQRHPEGGAS